MGVARSEARSQAGPPHAQGQGMRKNSAWIVVGAIVAVVVAWLMLRPLFGHDDKSAQASTPRANTPSGPGGPGKARGPENAPPLVQVTPTPPLAHPHTLSLRGRTPAN